MTSSLVERQVENAVRSMLDDKVVRFMRSVRKMASKQGGESVIENYQLLGKRALVVAGVAILVVQLTTSAVGFVVSRKNEEKRIERVVRRVLDEEQQKAEDASA